MKKLPHILEVEVISIKNKKTFAAFDRNFLSTFLFFILLSLVPYFIRAQDSSLTILPPKWSLQDCFEYAAKNNLQLQTLSLDVDISNQNLLQSKAAIYPNLSASSTQYLTNSKNANPVVGGFQTQANLASNYSLNSSMILYQGGYLRNNIQSQQLYLQAANLNVEQTKNDITIQITQAYLNILMEKENILALQNIVQTSQAQYNNGKTLFDAGSIAKKDLVQLQATLATDEYNVVLAQNQLKQNTLTLKQILQLPSSYNLQIQDSLNVVLPTGATDLQTVEDSALQNRPEVKNSEVALQQSNLQLKQAHTANSPTISAGGSLASGYSDDQNTKYFGQLNNNFYQRIGITLGIPIFNNRINKTNIEKSKIAIDQSEIALKNTKLVLSQQVEQAFINVSNSEAQYKAAQVQFAANEENYRIANEQLKLGAVNMVDFLVQKNLFVQAQQNLIQAKYNVVMSYGIYEFYMGKPITL
ncbi:MAG TPA: TolC family protein [Hanamia sp.]|nr:TolC family protein [Hanamia sp.]